MFKTHSIIFFFSPIPELNRSVTRSTRRQLSHTSRSFQSKNDSTLCPKSSLILKSRQDFCNKNENKSVNLSHANNQISFLNQSNKYEKPPNPDQFPSWSFESRPFFRFEIIHKSTKSNARVGRLHTPHGIVETPGFVPVATNAALKGIDFRKIDRPSNICKDMSVDGLGQARDNNGSKQLVFCNTYHLMLHPGTDIIREAGGLHNFTGRTPRNNHPLPNTLSGLGSHSRSGKHGGPFITDSGGFQIFSLAHEKGVWEGKKLKNKRQQQGELKARRRGQAKNGWNVNLSGPDTVQISEEGVTFRSYRDGSKLLLTPESTILAQKDLGADIIIPLDDLPSSKVSGVELEESLDRTHRWEARSLLQHLKNVNDQAIYSVIHGGTNAILREKSIKYLTSLPFDGYAIGGSFGNSRDELKSLLGTIMPMFKQLPNGRNDNPRHLLGIGDEESIRSAVSLGIDTMDSCFPTRLGRHGTLLTRNGMIRIKRGKYTHAFGEKIDDNCTCRACSSYDRAYLNHLFKANEPLAVMLGTEHNLQYMKILMEELRNDIIEGRI
mmetsp:Transcript_7229/g.10356  ORF Transcript_7229/g.10356 Transcript_7229/m.10356 type:complete len:551 (+) Transcript_7229:27-1679(+)